jgi:hypothetical protein
MKFELDSVPFILGIKKPAKGFRSLGRAGQRISA